MSGKLRENIESQLNEIDFIRGLYDTVKVSPHSILEEFQSFIDGRLDDVYNQLTCTVSLKDLNPPAEIDITIPHSYPHSSLHLLTAVRGHSYLGKKLSDYVSTFQSEHDTGTFCLSFVVDFVRENCECGSTETDVHEALSSVDPPCRVWLLSHHIYNKTKRKNLLEITAERGLGGFTLPGKPGVICLEGDPKLCLEAVSIIKSWNWQRIRVKFEEKSVKYQRFGGKYQELTCYKESQNSGDRPHMDLGLFSKFLDEHELSFAFGELFEFEKK